MIQLLLVVLAQVGRIFFCLPYSQVLTCSKQSVEEKVHSPQRICNPKVSFILQKFLYLLLLNFFAKVISMGMLIQGEIFLPAITPNIFKCC